MSRFFNSLKVVPYFFIAFPIAVIFGFVGYPTIYAINVSFRNWHILDETNRGFVGLKNYIGLFSDRRFLNAFWNTINFSVVYVITIILIGLLLALFIKSLPGLMQNFVKSVVFLPVVVSMVPVSIIFLRLMAPQEGMPFNYYLSLIGLGPIKWFTDQDIAMNSVQLVTVWKNAGFTMMIFLAGILGIPKVYNEAAMIDGANAFQQFWRITLPLLRNTILFLMVTSFIGSFQSFTQMFVLTGGAGPGNSTATLGFEIYRRGFNTYDMGSASAMGFVMLIFILIFTIIQFKVLGGNEDVF